MNAVTSYVANVNRVSANVPTSDPRFDMRLTEKFEDDASDHTGWTWVAAIMIGGVLIISGYLEQESTRTERPLTQISDQRYYTNVAVAQRAPAGTAQAHPRADKGY